MGRSLLLCMHMDDPRAVRVLDQEPDEGCYAGEGVDPRPIYTEAADLLQKVYAASCASLGSVHMQSITALTTLARAQSNLGEDDKAIETFKRAIHDCRYTLGRSHPFRLEAMRR